MVGSCRIPGKSVYVVMLTDNIKHEGLSKESWKENWPENKFAKNTQCSKGSYRVKGYGRLDNFCNGFDKHAVLGWKILKLEYMQYIIKILNTFENAILTGIKYI